MPTDDITVKGAREHNLRSVNLTLPRGKMICLTGVSGSGKSSLAFDTLYAEGQRRYVESLSSYARQFMGQMPKPDVDKISGLSPTISISQKSTGHNPRSTVGTVTEIYDFLRVLYARVGTSYCPACNIEVAAQSREQIASQIEHVEAQADLLILAPLIRGQKGEYRDLFETLRRRGYARARVDGRLVRLQSPPDLDRNMRHSIEVVIDHIPPAVRKRARVLESVELALAEGEGSVLLLIDQSAGGADADDAARWEEAHERLYSSQYSCPSCGQSFTPPSPQLFSFNSPQGMCTTCSGLGELYTFIPEQLVAEPKKSLKKGALRLVGPAKDWGQYRKHLYQNAAAGIEKLLELKSGTLLSDPWESLDSRAREYLIWGTGNRELDFSWGAGRNKRTYRAHWSGLIPELIDRYESTKNKLQLRQFEKYMDTIACPDCHGARLNEQALAVRLETAAAEFDPRSRSIDQFAALTVSEAARFISDVRLDDSQMLIASEALKEIRARLGFLLGVGLDYLTLARQAPTLSGGESQRIRLAGQIGSGLVGVLYILDEPSIGLHPRDNDRLIETMLRLKDRGNTLIVVEHDEETMRAADLIVDFGPGAGVKGGKIVASGKIDDLTASKRSVTGQFLSGARSIDVPPQRRDHNRGHLTISEARHNNLKNIDVTIPLGTFVCVTGVSGSGKSSLIGDILEPALRRDLNGGESEPGRFGGLSGLEQLDKMIAIDQSPIGRTPRSNPATYVKVFDEIRQLYTQLPEAKRRGYGPGRFSFNVDGGRCAACDGNGATKLEMDFLADVWVTCPVCEGARYNRETLQVKYRDHSIADCLDLDVSQAIRLFENIPKIHAKLTALRDVGLEYLKLGQPSPTLSGGEAQRIKLTRELSKKATGKTIYLLDEPTTGLHFADIKLLLQVLQDLVDRGNTVVVVEHNLDVIKTADWIIDLGPEGGEEGGQIVASGTPEKLAGNPASHTGRALANVLPNVKQRRGKKRSAAAVSERSAAYKQEAIDRLLPTVAGQRDAIRVEGAEQHNLRHVDVTIPRDAMSVFCGPSGSGKSSLAMDTIYAEGQRRYVESLSSYARQFIGQAQKPRVERIEGLSPAVALEQKNVGHTPRSTVGTVTEVYDYLRIFFARLGTMYCPACEIPVSTQTADEITDKIMEMPSGTRFYLLAPRDVAHGTDFQELWQRLKQEGYARVRVDGISYAIDDVPELERKSRHSVEIVIDRLKVAAKSRSRIAEGVELALSIGAGVLQLAIANDDRPEQQWEVVTHSQHRVCGSCGRSFEQLTPHHFSFNSSLGWCQQCEGLGTQTGTNPAALFDAERETLREGVSLLWPGVDKRMSQWMLAALHRQADIDPDQPIDHFSVRERRRLMHGTGERWFEVRETDGKSDHGRGPVLFRFQFKGFYPALQQAARLSPTLRMKLERFVDRIDCTSCDGSRLRDDAAAMRFEGVTIADVVRMPLDRLDEMISSWKLEPRRRKIAGELLREIRTRVKFLRDVGLDYLTLHRAANTLSGGEAQRIRLASQLGSGLCGLTYVLDEPTIGLHPRDNGRLLSALHGLRDLGNTLLVVEHDRDVIEGSDQLFDFGPGSGRYGGQVLATGQPQQVAQEDASPTAKYLSGSRAIPVPARRRISFDGGEPLPPHDGWLTVHGAQENTLRNVDVRFPLGALTVVTGVSGSGKSSLIDDILYPALARRLHRASVQPGRHREISGMQLVDKVIRVDQSPLSGGITSNAGTYTGAFDLIRQVFARSDRAYDFGWTPRHFSFNVPGGRCETCEGVGQRCIEMHFLPDVWVPCEDCQGRRYREQILEAKVHGKSIADVLEMQVSDAVHLFADHPKLVRILQTLCDVGLGYVALGQAAPTLSGGEAQRVKLAAELARPDTGRTLYLLDEPTTGLHFDDIRKLLSVLHRLVDAGNSVVVVEHNLDVIKQADWVIDMGPEAGLGGGTVVITGTPEQVAAYATARRPKKRGRSGKAPEAAQPRSYTGEYLGAILQSSPVEELESLVAPSADWHQAAGQSEMLEPEPEDAGLDEQQSGKDWHTVRLSDRNGDPVKWDGRTITAVMDAIEREPRLKIDWSHPTIIEARGEGRIKHWFLHAFSAERWWLKLRFRVPPGTFARDLSRELALPPLHKIIRGSRLPRERRVRFKERRDFQEVEVRLHRWEEVDRPEFWSFVERAISAYLGPPPGGQERESESPEAATGPDRSAGKPAGVNAATPWVALGRKWHELGKGFGTTKRRWKADLARQVFDTLEEVASGIAELNWSEKEQVTVTSKGQHDPTVIAETKHADALYVVLKGRTRSVPKKQLSRLGIETSVRPSKKTATVRLPLRDSDLHQETLRTLLQDHLKHHSAAEDDG